jgi:hypothetical protein
VQDMGERLTDADPAVQREAFRQFVSRIECEWKKNPEGMRPRYELVRGDVKLRPQTMNSVYGLLGHSSGHPAWHRHP